MNNNGYYIPNVGNQGMNGMPNITSGTKIIRATTALITLFFISSHPNNYYYNTFDIF